MFYAKYGSLSLHLLILVQYGTDVVVDRLGNIELLVHYYSHNNQRGINSLSWLD
jgi:hypothetical protein